ncbi:MAG: hypothetical protein Q7S06_03175 [Nanoarchaeota archaeon]|nr:hypothetical protein [Nanoarchaeota archaeon]
MQNKRGQELSTTAIILIILGVLVLVILIVGFALGWNRIAPWLSKDNINQVVDSCNSACTSQSVYDFCLRKREVIAESTTYTNFTCNYMQGQMETDLSKDFGIQSCAGMTCVVQVLDMMATPITKEASCTGFSGKYIQAYTGKNTINKYLALYDVVCPA